MENEHCPLLGEDGILLRLLSNNGRGDKVKLLINRVTGGMAYLVRRDPIGQI